MKRTKTFTVEYNYFEPGTYVVPTSNRCPLTPDVYRVRECIEPKFPGEDCIVFVHESLRGYSTEYLREADPSEHLNGYRKYNELP